MSEYENVTPEAIEAAFSAQRERVPYSTGSLADVTVVLPTLDLDGWYGWLCRVCLRVPLRNQKPWSWFGCEYCRSVDARVASLLGGKRFLPLGQHSMMNGLGVRLADTSPVRVRAAHDQLLAMGQEWQVIGRWRDHLAEITVQQWLEEHGDDATPIPLADWQERYPADGLASAITYASLLDRHYPWVFDVAPQAADALWLTGVDLHE